MTLNRKFFLFFLVLLVMFMLSVVGFMHYVLYPGYEKLEALAADDYVKRINRTLDTEQENLLIHCRDWSLWDDMYRYIKDRDASFIKSNMTKSAIVDGKLDKIALIDLHGRLISFIDSDMYKKDGNDSVLFDHNGLRGIYREIDTSKPPSGQGINGLVWLNKIPAFVTIMPVYPSEPSGSHNGYVLMIRMIQGELLARMNASSGIKFTLTPLERLRKDSPTVFHKLNDSKSFISFPMNDQSLALYLLERDINGENNIVVHTTIKRSVMGVARNNMAWFLQVNSFFGVVFFLLSVWIIRRQIIRPVTTLSNDIRWIIDHQTYRHSNVAKTDDEIGVLTNEFNDLIDSLIDQRKVSRTDALSGLNNRRSLDEELDLQYRHLLREQMPLSILMIDIDHFKAYNDVLGHLQGDEVIIQVAAIIQSVLKRPLDFAARYGGEEFVILLPYANESGAIDIASEIMNAFKDLRMKHPDSDTKPYITVSIGVVTTIPDAKTSAQQLLENADKALYAAKANGRNRFEIYNEL